jgi:cyclopropane-fatty-acyl-phospholipid synthase
MFANASKVGATAGAVALLESLFDKSSTRRVGFRLWDGSRWPDDRPRDATMVLQHPDALEHMLLPGTEAGLAEAYLRNDFDVEGDIEAALDLAEHLLRQTPGESNGARWLGAWRHLPMSAKLRAVGRLLPNGIGAKHSRERDRRAVTFHYDISNDFYALWLDRRMIYSCGYFQSPDDALDDAQRQKLDHICRKLRLEPGQRLLDIGCGWGALVLHAAAHYGVEATGITLSERQAEWARARVAETGLTARVRIELCDYRDFLRATSPFDAVVSVGMAEHVGRENLPEYFRTVREALKPRGVFLNHAIALGVVPRPDAGGDWFIDRYVFPDSDVPPMAVVATAAESTGFEIRDVECLREHYALTLRHWVHRLESAHDEALHFVDEPTYRTWRLYMAGSAYGFAAGQLGIYQTLLSRLDARGAAGLPLTREDWYDSAPSRT